MRRGCNCNAVLAAVALALGLADAAVIRRHWDKRPKAEWYGPDECVGVWRDEKSGTCMMQTDCAKDTEIDIYEFGLVCVDEENVMTRHLFGTGSFGHKETFETLIKCSKCLALDEYMDGNKAVNQLSEMVNEMRKDLKDVSGSVAKLNAEVFPKADAPAGAPAAAAPAPAAAKVLLMSHNRKQSAAERSQQQEEQQQVAQQPPAPKVAQQPPAPKVAQPLQQTPEQPPAPEQAQPQIQPQKETQQPESSPKSDEAASELNDGAVHHSKKRKHSSAPAGPAAPAVTDDSPLQSILAAAMQGASARGAVPASTAKAIMQAVPQVGEQQSVKPVVTQQQAAVATPATQEVKHQDNDEDEGEHDDDDDDDD